MILLITTIAIVITIMITVLSIEIKMRQLIRQNERIIHLLEDRKTSE